ncbi:AAC(3) family N-acetyltransferase [bacterium]|nr:AAC(3) family N-acetyltransferase [bacterium]MBU1918287.1 AAC(3) family N-acetyltransferase [bacterium]
MVQSSFDRFYNFDGTAEDVLNVLERIVGDRGTLMMPAHPRYNIKTPSFFDVRKTPTRTGLLCELFRRKSGVLRSLHPTHSVCARGPLAKMLVEEHHKDPLSCGLLSPYAKLVEFSGNILGLGLPPGYTTFLHVVEDLDVDAYPKRVYADKIFEFTIMDERGDKFTMKLKRRDNRMGARMDLPRFTKYLNEKGHRVFDVHGIPCFVARAKPLLDELKDLTKRGILLYR